MVCDVANEALVELLIGRSIMASRVSVHASIMRQDGSEVKRLDFQVGLSPSFEKTDLDYNIENIQDEGIDRVGMSAIALSPQHPQIY